MNIRAIALSTALLFGTGMYAQTNAPANTPDNGTITTTQSNNPNNPNNGTTNNTTPNGMANTAPTGTNYGHYGSSGGWGLWGLLGLFGFFGLARGGRRRDDTVRTTNLPPR